MAIVSRRKQAEQAHRLLRSALEQYNTGIALAARGEPVAAEAAYRRALELKPDFAEAHFYLGALCHQQGRWGEAEAAYRRGLALKPDVAEGWNNLGNVLQEQGRLQDAEPMYRRAIDLNPGFAEAHNNLGLVCQAQGRLEEALGHQQNALQIEPGNPLYWVFFSECISHGPLEGVDPDKVLAALTKREVDSDKLAGVAAELVCRHEAVKEVLLLAQDEQSASGVEDRLRSGTLGPLMELPLLNALLKEAIVPNLRLERLLVLLRKGLLLSASRGARFDPATERFLASLALQCFANEYLYAESPEERQAIESLAEHPGQLPAAKLLLLACYRPLHAFRVDPISAEYEAHVRAVLQRQVVEPALEERLKQTIPSLTAIASGVSTAVREQYEQNPYPRWRRDGTPGGGRPVHAVLQKLFPRQPIPNESPAHPEILVAGCGTGSHSIQVARHFANARILAIDLSLASLAYARRMTEEFGLANIEYQQADILQLGDWDRRFDVIESCGVLHHMSDPLAGWRILTGLLKPGGYMKIGLYSRRARRDIGAARDLIAARGYRPTLEGIRLCRAEMMAADSPFSGSAVLDSADFYSTSACRDLLFHVHEHLFSPAEIERHLKELDLQLLGFELSDPHARSRYEARFPGDPACSSLANWEAFEADHPDTFIHLYEFWARREPTCCS